LNDFAPTPYAEVNILLAELLRGIHQTLGEQFTALYLSGSLAMGGFNPGRSDIDFLAVTAADLGRGELTALQAMHRRLASAPSHWALKLEGSYFPASSLRRYDRQRSNYPHLSTGSGDLVVEQHDSGWVVQLWIARRCGLRLYGPPPAALIDPISPDELTAAVRELLFSWWAPVLSDPSRLLDPAYQAYAVLTMPRMLYTFTHASVVPKPEAAAWAQRALEPRWAGLIAAALDWNEGLSFDRLEETLALIRYTQERAVQYKPESAIYR